ncbi:MAG: hypothetical protein JZU52_15385 [Lamprocystis purpurea]|jgi:uncharacterized protein YecT (DUF1311 family)|uniref:lysozyme inhibitor LprI family protein n=1 Tax=Lamprocystis purpurea TaxID=61598 RepID=UPI00036CD6D9|nr:hypothetical protein [Lamprocystis purpurea]MBV5274960.1 hypothetical protein [Lamprocystis purpurea]
MKNKVIGQLAVALSGVVYYGLVAAECASVDRASSACRYPAGDAWCARHGDGNRYAYKDGCVDENNTADTNSAPRSPAPAKSWSPVVDWDCGKARTAVERLICANPDVRAQDGRMGALYADLQASGRLPERLQKAWLLGQRNACDNADCLRAVYAERIRYLESLAVATAAAGVPAVAPVAGSPDAAREPARRPPPPTTAETATMQPPEPIPEPIPEPEPIAETALTSSGPSSQTGIPMLPLPEAPTPAAGGAPTGDAPHGASPGASVKSGAGVLLGLAVLAIAFGLFVWRDRRRVDASSRRGLAVFARRVQAGWGLRRGGWRGLRRLTSAPADASAGTFGAMPIRASASVDVPLSDDLIARLRALARPGEPLSVVVARAVAALEVTSTPPPTAAVPVRPETGV